MNPTALLLAATLLTPADDLDTLRRDTGTRGGLVCVVGDEDALADALARDGTFLVHHLVDTKRMQERRKACAGLHGRLVVETRLGTALPYPDRFVDLVVLGKGETVKEAELQRVLAVDGVARLADGRVWRPKADPRLGEWTHKWHGPDGNPLSPDRVSGPPTAIQWAAGPMFSDGAVGGKAPRLGGGAFVFIDSVDGALAARSAANGLQRWRVDRDFSATADLALADGKVYAHAPVKLERPVKGVNAHEVGPLTAFDLATGKELTRLEKALSNTEASGREKPGMAQFVIHRGGLLQAVGPELAWSDAKTGERRWTQKLEGAHWFSPVILGDAVVAAESLTPAQRRRLDNTSAAEAVSAFRLGDGKRLWRLADVLPPEARSRKGNTLRVALSPLVAGEGLVILHAGTYQSQLPNAFVAALDAATGKELWRHTIPEYDWTNTVESSRVVVRDGVVYYMGGKGVAAWEARTGKEHFPFRKRPKYAFNGYGECSGSRATADWLMANGLCYWDAKGELVATTWAARSACGTGVFPGYGMIYALPTGCDCASYGRGYLGLACTPVPDPIPDDRRLVKGPAFGKVEKGPVAGDDWPIFLHDPQRSGATAVKLPGKLKQRWRMEVTTVPSGPLAEDRRRSENYLGPVSAPVAAAGLVLVALPEEHRVVALDAATGRPRWGFTAGGVIDGPPTVHEGLALFGCHDGEVYALRLSDGELAWRFLAAPVARKAMLHGQLASAFPVHGSVIVLDGKLIATAGFHSDLGGLHAWVLEPATGRVLHKTVYRGSKDGQKPAVNDILGATAEGDAGWMRYDAGFTPKGEVLQTGQRKELPPVKKPVVVFDRAGAFVRFPHEFRGGSTHGWKGAMLTEGLQTHRLCVAEGVAYGLIDPRPEDNHPVRADKTKVLWAVKGDPKNPLWITTADALGRKESYGGVIRAGERLYVGGGRRDGSRGFVLVVDAASGKLLGEHALPGRVAECGLAVAGGRLYAACEDGSVVCLGQ